MYLYIQGFQVLGHTFQMFVKNKFTFYLFHLCHCFDFLWGFILEFECSKFLNDEILEFFLDFRDLILSNFEFNGQCKYHVTVDFPFRVATKENHNCIFCVIG